MLIGILLLLLPFLSAQEIEDILKIEAECLERTQERSVSIAMHGKLISPVELKFQIVTSPKEATDYFINDSFKECQFYECLVNKSKENGPGLVDSTIQETIMQHYKNNNMDIGHIRKCFDRSTTMTGYQDESKKNNHLIDINGETETVSSSK
ncbi:PREDICTED: uncharacterized protein LOC108556663 [Nicrophorus vespilloides]|uniref:Uncharacterized protein LOC108556663 n=1 Tax=Nicrophorus vespilloides TaxID=110193 RepID=A0ABM1M1A4_NICVS|nr:PREDICTED: uncharacterized protein LOC108556663 [Nicrophorus vespilloides]